MRFSPRVPAFAASVFAASVVGSAGCSDLGQIALGGDDTDGFQIGASAATAHLADAIDGGGDLTFQQLFEKGDGLTFKDAPNPTKLLSDTNARDDDFPTSGRFPLTVLTYNVAMLDVDLLGFIPYAETPELNTRRKDTPAKILGRGADIVLLQEVWLAEDVEEFFATADEFGYRGFVQDREGHNDGLAIFIKESDIAGGTTTQVDFAAYGSQNGTEYFPGPGIQRGWMSVRFVHPDIGGVRVYDTHMQAFPENWAGRMKQGRELGIIMRTAPEEDGTPDDISILGGDFNAGPYYKKAEWNAPGGVKQDRWFHNELSYPVLLTYGDLIDLAIMGRPAEEALADITLGDTVVNDADASTEIPGAEEGWCDKTPAITFTATDCNSLYFEQYAGTEYPARLDHVFGHDPDGRIIASRSEIVFTEKERFGDVDVEPSDHFGVEVDLLITGKQ